MRYFLIGLIYLYKQVPGNFHNHCNFEPTCSTYAIDCLKNLTTGKALFLIGKRILKCNPFQQHFTYDPAPTGKE